MLANLRRWWAIVRATTLEMSSEPLALLLTMSAAATVALTSSLHFHQFGEPTRMSRDAGLSALLVFGLLYAVFCTIKVFRREVESGTLQMALSHPVSRPAFFISKIIGAIGATLIFALTVAGVVLTTVAGAEVGGLIAQVKGDVATVWGWALVGDVCVVVIPLLIAAALNRFARFRFTTTTTVLMLAVSCAVTAGVLFVARRFCAAPQLASFETDALRTAVRLIPAMVMVVLPAPVFVCASAAFAVRFRDHAAASLAGVLFIISLPALSNYYVSDALAKGGTVPWGYVGAAAVAAVPLFAAFLGLGFFLFKDRDVG